MMRTSALKIFGRCTAIDAAGAVVLATLVAAAIFGLIGPLAVRGQDAVTAFETAARQNQRTNGTVTAVRTLTEEISRNRARIAASPLHLRTVDALNEQLAALVGLSAECGLGVDDIKPGTAVAGTRFVAVPIAMNGRGTYRASVDFLHRLHERCPDIGVGGFQLSGNPETRGGGRCAFALQWLALPRDRSAAVAAAR